MARVESTTGWFKCVLGPGAPALAEAPAATAPFDGRPADKAPAP